MYFGNIQGYDARNVILVYVNVVSNMRCCRGVMSLAKVID